jgi:uncharacterized membrane protein YedE/YeeE
METAFTPVASLAGGAMIGLAAVALMFLRGRIMGATGILAGVLMPASLYDWTWRAMMLGGFIVGVGVTLGSGCTSGHGVCGLARLSPRSFAATGTFMLTTGLTVYAIRHMLGG